MIRCSNCTVTFGTRPAFDKHMPCSGPPVDLTRVKTEANDGTESLSDGKEKEWDQGCGGESNFNIRMAETSDDYSTFGNTFHTFFIKKEEVRSPPPSPGGEEKTEDVSEVYPVSLTSAVTDEYNAAWFSLPERVGKSFQSPSPSQLHRCVRGRGRGGGGRGSRGGMRGARGAFSARIRGRGRRGRPKPSHRVYSADCHLETPIAPKPTTPIAPKGIITANFSTRLDDGVSKLSKPFENENIAAPKTNINTESIPTGANINTGSIASGGNQNPIQVLGSMPYTPTAQTVLQPQLPLGFNLVPSVQNQTNIMSVQAGPIVGGALTYGLQQNRMQLVQGPSPNGNITCPPIIAQAPVVQQYPTFNLSLHQMYPNQLPAFSGTLPASNLCPTPVASTGVSQKIPVLVGNQVVQMDVMVPSGVSTAYSCSTTNINCTSASSNSAGNNAAPGHPAIVTKTTATTINGTSTVGASPNMSSRLHKVYRTPRKFPSKGKCYENKKWFAHQYRPEVSQTVTSISVAQVQAPSTISQRNSCSVDRNLSLADNGDRQMVHATSQGQRCHSSKPDLPEESPVEYPIRPSSQKDEQSFSAPHNISEEPEGSVKTHTSNDTSDRGKCSEVKSLAKKDVRINLPLKPRRGRRKTQESLAAKRIYRRLYMKPSATEVSVNKSISSNKASCEIPSVTTLLASSSNAGAPSQQNSSPGSTLLPPHQPQPVLNIAGMANVPSIPNLVYLPQAGQMGQTSSTLLTPSPQCPSIIGGQNMWVQNVPGAQNVVQQLSSAMPWCNVPSSAVAPLSVAVSASGINLALSSPKFGTVPAQPPAALNATCVAKSQQAVLKPTIVADQAWVGVTSASTVTSSVQPVTSVSPARQRASEDRAGPSREKLKSSENSGSSETLLTQLGCQSLRKKSLTSIANNNKYTVKQLINDSRLHWAIASKSISAETTQCDGSSSKSLRAADMKRNRRRNMSNGLRTKPMLYKKFKQRPKHTPSSLEHPNPVTRAPLGLLASACDSTTFVDLTTEDTSRASTISISIGASASTTLPTAVAEYSSNASPLILSTAAGVPSTLSTTSLNLSSSAVSSVKKSSASENGPLVSEAAAISAAVSTTIATSAICTSTINKTGRSSTHLHMSNGCQVHHVGSTNSSALPAAVIKQISITQTTCSETGKASEVASKSLCSSYNPLTGLLSQQVSPSAVSPTTKKNSFSSSSPLSSLYDPSTGLLKESQVPKTKSSPHTQADSTTRDLDSLVTSSGLTSLDAQRDNLSKSDRPVKFLGPLSKHELAKIMADPSALKKYTSQADGDEANLGPIAIAVSSSKTNRKFRPIAPHLPTVKTIIQNQTSHCTTFTSSEASHTEKGISKSALSILPNLAVTELAAEASTPPDPTATQLSRGVVHQASCFPNMVHLENHLNLRPSLNLSCPQFRPLSSLGSLSCLSGTKTSPAKIPSVPTPGKDNLLPLPLMIKQPSLPGPGGMPLAAYIPVAGISSTGSLHGVQPILSGPSMVLVPVTSELLSMTSTSNVSSQTSSVVAPVTCHKPLKVESCENTVAVCSSPNKVNVAATSQATSRPLMDHSSHVLKTPTAAPKARNPEACRFKDVLSKSKEKFLCHADLLSTLPVDDSKLTSLAKSLMAQQKIYTRAEKQAIQEAYQEEMGLEKLTLFGDHALLSDALRPSSVSLSRLSLSMPDSSSNFQSASEDEVGSVESGGPHSSVVEESESLNEILWTQERLDTTGKETKACGDCSPKPQRPKYRTVRHLKFFQSLARKGKISRFGRKRKQSVFTTDQDVSRPDSEVDGARRSDRINTKPRLNYAELEQSTLSDLDECEPDSEFESTKKSFEIVTEIDDNELGPDREMLQIEEQKGGDVESLKPLLHKSEDTGQRNMEVKNSTHQPTVKDRLQTTIDESGQSLSHTGDFHVIQEASTSSSMPDFETRKAQVACPEVYYSSESESDLVSEDWDDSQKTAAERQKAMLRCHREVTMFLVKHAEKFVSVDGTDEHLCKICNRYKTNGVFKLSNHLKKHISGSI